MLSTAFASILALAATVSAQGVTSAIAPSGGAPAGCYPNYKGTFVISTPNVTESGLKERQNTALGITLVNGILTDPQGRIGYIAANSQFQFDGPPQAGAIYTAGWSVCANGSLAIGSDVTFYKCLSGTFYNLYLDNDAGQCIECFLVASPLEAGDGPIAGSVTPSVAATGSVVPSSAPNATITTSTRNGTMSMSMSSSSSGAAGGGMTQNTTTMTTGGKTTAKTTKPAQTTTTGGGSGGTGAAASSSTGLAAAIGPVGDVFGIFAGLMAFAMI